MNNVRTIPLSFYAHEGTPQDLLSVLLEALSAGQSVRLETEDIQHVALSWLQIVGAAKKSFKKANLTCVASEVSQTVLDQCRQGGMLPLLCLDETLTLREVLP